MPYRQPGGCVTLGEVMTTITAPEARSTALVEVDERSAHRINGWLIAIVASVLLWSVSGAALWGIINIVN